MNIFRRKKYIRDSQTMMFYSLLATIFFLPFSNIAATCTLIAGWIFYILKAHFDGRWGWKKTFMDIPLAVFVIMGFLSIINSPQKAFSFYNYIHLVAKYVLLYYLTIQSINDEKQIKKIFVVVAAAALIVILYGFMQYIVGINTAGMGWTDKQAFPGVTMRIYSTWHNPNLLAGYLDMILALLFGVFIIWKNKKARKIIAVLFIMAAICMGMTYARGACFSIAAAVAVYGIFYDRKILLPFVIFIAVVLYIDTTLFYRLLSVFMSMDTSSELRIALWESTIAMILDHPFLGIGWGAYYFVYPTYDFYMQGHFIKIVHAHNMYLNIMAEIGIIGFLGYMTCFFSAMWYSLRNFKYLASSFLGGSLLGCGLALMSLAFNGLTDYVLFNTDLSMFFWFTIGIIVVIMGSPQMQAIKNKLAMQHVGLTSLPDFPYEKY
ncbi:O-antigen ligase family protein [Pectinatus sottacetonis]|uniref:O-antigen ligase family protein n=1 Tax=Pectinatus sottacetonis TaxID=1002795 RepID=UPI0018C785B0|nr:O-antigen ligase family protein [Pectinatus sottacetonis]